MGYSFAHCGLRYWGGGVLQNQVLSWVLKSLKPSRSTQDPISKIKIQNKNKQGRSEIFSAHSRKGQLLWSERKERDWRGGSLVKSICCSCKGAEFCSQHPHGSSQPCVSTVPGDLDPLAPTSCTYTHSGKYTHKTNKSKINKIKMVHD